ncbi:MAG TPA: heavy metal translocating P-type ATPase [Candidatus Acidoferrales bacterium]|nr:heavy metal translocating P-type ATPase [Candidatus Acidoferrales bacterium]
MRTFTPASRRVDSPLQASFRRQARPPYFKSIWLEYGKELPIAVFTLVSILSYLLLHFGWKNPQWESVPLYAALAVGGVPILVNLTREAFKLHFGSDWLAGISIITAVLLNQYLVGSIVVLMLSGGSALERYATHRASSALRALVRRMPTVAHRVTDAVVTAVPIDSIVPGDLLEIFPHEICPVDGEVIEGYGRMDESYLTGEPFEISKAPGSQVLSGAINHDTVLRVRASRPAEDSRYARILRVVSQAEQNRPPLRRLADRLGGWYTPLAVFIGVLGWIFSGSSERFLAVVVIATPCPLLIGIPVAIIGGISTAARRGVVIKNPSVLEQIGLAETFIFDKTGTLTYGRPILTDIIVQPGMEHAKPLQFAASLEQYSRHPLAQAVLDAAKNRGIPAIAPVGVSEPPGEGLSGSVDGHQVLITGRKQGIARQLTTNQDLPPAATGLECLVFIDQKLAALFRFHDQPRAESRSFIGHLGSRHQALQVILLSGDRRPEVEHLARTVGIEQIYAGASPEQKLRLVTDETARHKTLFVGDGINDAPAMLAATFSVALGGQNSSVTAEASDAVVMDSSLRKVDELIHIARRTRSIALQTAIGGMALSGVGMLVAALGYLPPLTGAVAQEALDLIAILNALRAAMEHPKLSDF